MYNTLGFTHCKRPLSLVGTFQAFATQKGSTVYASALMYVQILSSDSQSA